MTIPKDVLRFEVLLYLSLLLDALSAAFFGVGTDETSEATRQFLNLLSAVIIAGLFVLVWLAARRQKNWARWTLFGFFVLTAVLYLGSSRDMTFGLRTVIDLVSLALSAVAFFFAFTAEARLWFKS